MIPTIPQNITVSQDNDFLQSLLNERQVLLDTPPYEIVTGKTLLAASGNPHDYVSYGPYWWPDPTKPDGKPFVRRDGEVYPLARKYDDVKLEKMLQRVYSLACLAYFNHDTAAAEKAIEQMRVFFLDDATKMNPHLRYGQAIPGICDGRVIGIIDTFRLVLVADAVAMLGNQPAMTTETLQGMKDWFGAYADWLHTDQEARKDYGWEQNHGLSYHTQNMAYAIISGKLHQAKEHADIFGKLLVKAVAPDGSLPRETIRTKSWGYSCFALHIAMHGIGCARNLGYDYLAPGTETRAAITRAVDFLLSFHSRPEAWPYQQIIPINFDVLGAILRQLHACTGEQKYAEALILPGMGTSSKRERLFFK